ncbi:MAG TPA: hypothetical protein VMW68_04390 [Methyloceanibacter sp.]|nr:hypothetical protein [Methyloceanibacter sp.]
MSPIRYLPLALFGAFSLAGLTAPQAAEPTLGAAVKAADAEYLEAPEIGVEDASPKILVGGGEDGLPPLDEELSLGPVRVTLTYVEEEPQAGEKAPADELPGDADEAPPEADQMPLEEELGGDALPVEDIPEEAILPEETGIGEQVWRAPVVTVYFDDPNPKAPQTNGEAAEDTEAGTAPSSDEDQTPETAQAPDPDQPADGDALGGGAETETAVEAIPAGPRIVATLKGPSAGLSDPPVSIQIADLDPTNAYPEVVVSFFTGGAHCCSVTSIITSNADGSEWTTVEVGEFDGGPMTAIDLDGDGTYEFETRDNAFLYPFACYACSEAPLRVLALQDGAMKDVSADPRFKPAHAAWLKTMIVGVPEQDVNGFLAGYVAQKIRLGEGKQAWALMLEYFDRNTDWGLEICDHDRDESGECPGTTTKVTFPQALERMLNENGYRIGG